MRVPDALRWTDSVRGGKSGAGRPSGRTPGEIPTLPVIPLRYRGPVEQERRRCPRIHAMPGSKIEWLIGDGDFVAWRSRGTGTQSGPLGPFPATHKRMDVVIIGMHRFHEGLVAETWTSWDNLAVLTQLGHMGATA